MRPHHIARRATRQVKYRSFTVCSPLRETIEPPPEPETPKATRQSKIIAVAVGVGLAFAYGAYRRRDIPAVKPADGFATFTLTDKEEISSTCSIFTLKPLSSRMTGLKVNADGGIYSVQLKQPQLQIARSYTMLPPIPGEPLDTLRLLIRKEEKGEVSGYLHTLKVGDDVEVRGPTKEYAFGNAKKVIFLAGGTGIAPAMKTADALKCDMHILWASRRREDCAGGVSDTVDDSLLARVSALWKTHIEQEKNTMVLMVDLLKRQNDGLKVDYFVDEEGSRIRPNAVSKLLDGEGVIFVSGPEGFIQYWAGPKQFVNGKEEQGSLGGVLSRMDLQGWHVVKL